MTTPLDQTRALDESRARFEATFGAAPFAWSMDRYHASYYEEKPSGDYRDVRSQAAWEAWQAAIASMAIPEGWQLVPTEITSEMWTAVNKLDDQMAAGGCDGKGCTIEQAWDCLLANSPTPPIAALAAKETT